MFSNVSTSSKEGHDSSGLKEEVVSFSKSSGAYLSARSELFGIEAREAGVVYKGKITSLVIAGLTLALGYVMLLVVAVALLGELFVQKFTGPLAGWIGSALALGGLHLLIGVIFLRKSRKGSSVSLFESTRAEWHKDQQWLSQNSKRES